MSKLELLFVLFPVGYINTILISDTKKVISDPLELGEFMMWVACWFYMACCVGIADRYNCWSVTPPVIHRVAPFWLNKYMSCHHFDEIISSLRYTNREVRYEDVFLHTRHMEEAWTKNMADEFNPSWTNVLEKITMEWYNNFPPGFGFVGQKPYLFVNKRHTI